MLFDNNVLAYFSVKTILPLFLRLTERKVESRTIYKQSDKNKKCLSVGNFVVRSLYHVCSLHQFMWSPEICTKKYRSLF